MKTKFFIWLVFTAIAVNTSAFTISPNTVFSIEKNTQVKLSNFDLKNDGIFFGDTTSVLIISNSRETKISGNDINLSSLKIDGNVMCNVEILSLTNDLILQSGVMNIGHNRLIIDGHLLNESNHTYVFAFTGTIEKIIKHLPAEQPIDVFGLQFTSANEMYDLKITRSHNPIVRTSRTGTTRSAKRIYDFCTPIDISNIHKQILLHEIENTENPVTFVQNFDGWKTVKNQNNEFAKALRVSTFSPNKLYFPKVLMVHSSTHNLFEIEGLEEYSNIRLKILNKNGQLLYDFFPYENNFDGKNLPCGTYYYVFSDEQSILPVKKSFFEVVR